MLYMSLFGEKHKNNTFMKTEEKPNAFAWSSMALNLS